MSDSSCSHIIIHLSIKSGIPFWLLSVAHTMDDSKVEEPLLKGHPEETEAACGARSDSEQALSSQMLHDEDSQLSVSGIRTKSDFVSLSQFSSIPMFQCFRRFCVALCFHVALILVGIRRNRCLQMSKNSSDDFVNIFFDTNIISLYGLTFDGRQDSA